MWIGRGRGSGAGGKRPRFRVLSERTLRRRRERYDADGAEGLCDRRPGKVPARAVAVDTVIEVPDPFDARYFDFTARHFRDKLVSEHDSKRGDTLVRPTLRAHGRTAKEPGRRLGLHGQPPYGATCH